MDIDITVIWFIIIVFATLMYIVMDGFDLGIGMLFSIVHAPGERDVMVNSVAPVWDGNETWLVLGGAGLFGAFPLAYAVIADALAIPLTMMLIGLIFRGVAFEFRFKATPSHRLFWDYAFAGGSLLATVSQGIVVGAVINGFDIADRRFAGSALDWLTPFNVFCGLGLVAAYLLLGSTWLIMKSDGALQERMRKLTRHVLLALLAVIAVVSIWTPLNWQYIAERWFTLPNFYWFVPVPILVTILSLWIWRLSSDNTSHARPFILTLGLIFLGFSGLGISLWPYIIPPHVTLWDAAAPPASQMFMLVGTLIIIPVILMYTAWSYYVFRGKVSDGEGYH
ncbi:cytochrome d ubiquinol oxidase subunit II [Citrobacter werkmanii]|uniref:Cytochrome d ubiquinol oxidase subunit II n=1 Tax=Citrobacter werkmanii TaxID=67827 RepID=A0AA37Z7X8_9ENTR|nr:MULTISPECIES: cytochrome d ubiquinol oxidase subunit II [Citrobacter]MDN8555277.1 cytochrome d ubiquinol oxidase subunit II [Citrobacter werkmanii]MDV7071920.1 cytochrome d ubiquinol oxidase subunit II [Citrobacter werkmanii]MEC3943996.1 cytochrome d ubiquinol oxidase subunit II [Citrobacter werkmanii]TKU07757.1 cytochrome d ubiquinol oxidase subunit II [Citrobacter sp. TBCS-15]TKU75459.1 cytochrome d ubiquinol oxidase subunit II [Citrobacter sp. wls706]